MRTLKSELHRTGYAQPVTKPVKPKQKVKEKLTKYDLLELMGTKRDTYKRVNGAVRRK